MERGWWPRTAAKIGRIRSVGLAPEHARSAPVLGLDYLQGSFAKPPRRRGEAAPASPQNARPQARLAREQARFLSNAHVLGLAFGFLAALAVEGAFAENPAPLARDDAARPRTVADLERAQGRGSAAGQPSAAEAPPIAASSDFFGRYLRVLGVLLVVLAGAGVAVWLVKRSRRSGGAFGRMPHPMEVLARMPLTQRHQLALVRIAQRTFVLGISPDGVSNLAELGDPREVIPAARGSNFEANLEDAGREYEEPAVESAAAPDPFSPYRREIERIKTMVGNWRLAAARNGDER